MALLFFTYLRSFLLTGLLLAGAGLLAACDREAPDFQGTDVSNTSIGQGLDMVDTHGQARTLADFTGKVTIFLFGFTHCPDICPTSLASLAFAIEQLGDDSAQVQVAMITVDPERDTPELLQRYVTAFQEDFIGLTGTAEQLAQTAKSFKAYYLKAPGRQPGEYTIDHSSSFYLFDKTGKVRVILPSQSPIEALISDIRQLL